MEWGGIYSGIKQHKHCWPGPQGLRGSEKALNKSSGQARPGRSQSFSAWHMLIAVWGSFLCIPIPTVGASKKLPHPCSCVQTLGLHTLLLVPWEELWPCRRVEGKPPLKKGFQQGSDCPVWIIGALCSLKALSLALSVFLVLWIFMFVLGQKVSMPGFFAAYNHTSILLNT